jgi:hypothetical protein
MIQDTLVLPEWEDVLTDADRRGLSPIFHANPIRMAWTASSANPNLRIASQVGPLPVVPAGFALGFALTAGSSFMQVGRYRGRHYMRDGYHRAFGLLSRGITVVPAFVRDIARSRNWCPTRGRCCRRMATWVSGRPSWPTTSTMR